MKAAAAAAAADVAGFMVRRLASYPLCKIHMSGSGSVSLLGTVGGRWGGISRLWEGLFVFFQRGNLSLDWTEVCKWSKQIKSPPFQVPGSF